MGFVLNSLSILDILSWQLAEADRERLGGCKIGLGGRICISRWLRIVTHTAVYLGKRGEHLQQKD